ncbi:MAG: CRTAC1 family protein [Acidobacteriota bacterium]
MNARTACLFVGAVGAASCGDKTTPQATPGKGDWFVDVAQRSGLDFVHQNGMTGEHYFCEVVGPGPALFDYDGDGDLDVFIPQGHTLDPKKSAAEAPSSQRGGRLFRNDLAVSADGTRTMSFVDVTVASRIVALGYGMGSAVGDIDNDGDPDLYLTCFGHNQMWRNGGDGTFTDVTVPSGTDDQRWSTSAAFLDYDRDGLLDLYVVNYVNFHLESAKPCRSPVGRPDYCGPSAYEGEPDRLFRNTGAGVFEDASARSGISAKRGPGLGVICTDLDGDGWVDVYVANDGKPNFAWINARDGTFKDEALIRGLAVAMSGSAEASMGVDAGDIDNDGDEDIFIANLDGESNVLYRNLGRGMFADERGATGLAAPSLERTGFGASMLDYDNDGWLDVLTVNGAVKTIEAQALAGDPFPLRQRKQLFHNRGDGTFAEVSESTGAAFTLSEVGRGAAFGDVDNDGDTDVVVTNNNGRARLLENRLEVRGLAHHWLGMSFQGRSPAWLRTGALVKVFRPRGPTLARRSHSVASYCSVNDPRVIVGLGTDSAIDRLEVTWPSGATERFDAPGVDRYVTIIEGAGKPAER